MQYQISSFWHRFKSPIFKNFCSEFTGYSRKCVLIFKINNSETEIDWCFKAVKVRYRSIKSSYKCCRPVSFYAVVGPENNCHLQAVVVISLHFFKDAIFLISIDVKT